MVNQNFYCLNDIWTKNMHFFGETNPFELAEKYGTPLYIYNENILRTRCREIRNFLKYEHFSPNYSAKANTNLSLLKIIREEGFTVDAMSPGELIIEKKAGFTNEEIMFICNNVSDAELKFAIGEGVLVSVDSLSQLERFGKLNPAGKVVVRINPGVGAGHHSKVVTAGKDTKFGVDPTFISELKQILSTYKLHLAGINQHIGSLFLEGKAYMEAASFMLEFAEQFPELEFVDFGGGFGIPYKKEEGEKRLDLEKMGTDLDKLIKSWVNKTGRHIKIKVEPGRYLVAECGILLGEVHSVKTNSGKFYAGTDIGFNVFIRPVLYDSHHDIEVYSKTNHVATPKLATTVVGNICESGDIMAKNRMLPEIKEGNMVGIMDAGAYGMVMSSNYNCRLRPAEVLIKSDGSAKLIRKAETFEDITRAFDV